MLRTTNRIRPLLFKSMGIEKTFLFQQIKSETKSDAKENNNNSNQNNGETKEVKGATQHLETKLEKDQAISNKLLAQLVEEVYKDNGQSTLQKAKAGDAVAQFIVGWFFENGIVVKCNEVTSAEWYQQAATQGQPDAIAAMGRLHLFEKAFKDEKKAAHYFKQIKDLNNHLGDYARAFYQGYALDEDNKEITFSPLWEKLADNEYVRGLSIYATGIEECCERKELLFKKAIALNYGSAIRKLYKSIYETQDTFEAKINSEIFRKVGNSGICNGSQFMAAELKWGKNFGHLVPLDTIEFKFEKQNNYLYFGWYNHYMIVRGKKGGQNGELQECYYFNVMTNEKKPIPLTIQNKINHNNYHFNIVHLIANNLLCIYVNNNERMLVLWNEDLTKYITLIDFFGQKFTYDYYEDDYFVLFSKDTIIVNHILANPFVNQNALAHIESKTLLTNGEKLFEKFYTLNTKQGTIHLVIYTDFTMKLLNCNFQCIHEFTLNSQQSINSINNKFILNVKEQKFYHLRIDEDFTYLSERFRALVLDTYDLRQKQYLGCKLLMPRFYGDLESLVENRILNNFGTLFLKQYNYEHGEGLLLDFNTAAVFPLQIGDNDCPSNILSSSYTNLLHVTLLDDKKTLKYYTPQFVLNDAAKEACKLLQEKTDMPKPVCNVVVKYMSNRDLFFNFAADRFEKRSENQPMQTSMGLYKDR